MPKETESVYWNTFERYSERRRKKLNESLLELCEHSFSLQSLICKLVRAPFTNIRSFSSSRLRATIVASHMRNWMQCVCVQCTIKKNILFICCFHAFSVRIIVCTVYRNNRLTVLKGDVRRWTMNIHTMQSRYIQMHSKIQKKKWVATQFLSLSLALSFNFFFFIFALLIIFAKLNYL